MDKFVSITVDVDSVSSLFPFAEIEDNSFKKGLERFLDLFGRYNIKATFFIVGKDLKIDGNLQVIKELINQGHEIASHSMNHVQGISLLSKEDKVKEISEVERIVLDKTGEKVKGFRAPGWNIDTEILEILSERNYLYDSSIFPTSLIPAFKIVHYMKNRKMPKIQRKTMGSFTSMFKPTKIYQIKDGFFEFPITTVPFVRFPFFGTMIFEYGMFYFNLFYRPVKLRKFVNFEFHLAELVDKETDFDKKILNVTENKSYIPKCLNMDLSSKVKRYEQMLKKFSENFEFVTVKDAVKIYSESNK